MSVQRWLVFFSLNILALKASARPKNLALRKAARQSSTLDNNSACSASRAVDGIKADNMQRGNCSHTGYDDVELAWWEVDLGDMFWIDRVRILNRRDCCSERLHDVRIDVKEFKTGAGEKCAKKQGKFKIRWTDLTCIKPVFGRYVRITKPKNDLHDSLSICEASVFGNPVTTPKMFIERSAPSASDNLKKRSDKLMDCLKRGKCKGYYLMDDMAVDGKIWCPKR